MHNDEIKSKMIKEALAKFMISENLINENRAVYLISGYTNNLIQPLKRAVQITKEIEREWKLSEAIDPKEKRKFDNALYNLEKATNATDMFSIGYYKPDRTLEDIDNVKSILELIEIKGYAQKEVAAKTETVQHREETMGDIFICHPGERKKLARKIKFELDDLSKGKISCFVSEGGIPSGEEWNTMISKKIKEANEMVVLATPEIVGKAYCFQEMGAFLILGKKVHTILIGTNVDKLGMLIFKQYLEKIDEKELDDEDRLARTIAEKIYIRKTRA